MLRAYVIDSRDSWEKHLLLVEFDYNNRYHSIISIAPYEELCGRPCKTPVCWAELEDSLLLGLDLVRETTEKVAMIRDSIRIVQSRQKSCADKRRRPLEFIVGDLVMLKVSPLKGVGRFGKKGKLSRRYIRQFRVIKTNSVISYRLEFPDLMS